MINFPFKNSNPVSKWSSNSTSRNSSNLSIEKIRTYSVDEYYESHEKGHDYSKNNSQETRPDASRSLLTTKDKKNDNQSLKPIKSNLDIFIGEYNLKINIIKII